MGTVDLDGDGDRDITMCGFATPLYWIENLSDKTSLVSLNNNKKYANVFASTNSIVVTLNEEKMQNVISIIDIRGRVLFRIEQFGNEFKIPHNLTRGQYWITISNKKTQKSIKLIK